MNIRLFPLLLILPLLLFSCKAPRDGTTVVEGQVVDRNTGAAVADATVSIMQNKTSSSSAAYSHKQSYQTDSQGRFSVSFNGDEDYHYILMGSTPLGYYTDWNAAPSITSGRKNKDVKVPAQAPAWLGIKLVNEPPNDWTLIKITRCGVSGVCDFINPPDTTIVLPMGLSNQNLKYFWVIRDAQGDEVLFSKDIYLTGLDTTSIEIKF